MKKIFFLLVFLKLGSSIFCQTTIWTETFDVAEKGYWGGGSDMSGITKWTLDAGNCTLADADDFVKTVATSGGRMQAVDIDGEAVWTSETIDISAITNITVTVEVSETGSSTNTNKYIRVYYKVDAGTETLFETNGENIGDFGTFTAIQSNLSGGIIQIIIKINNPNAGDAIIFDNIVVSGTLITNNSDSHVSNGVSSEPNSISSIQNDPTTPFQVLDFTFTDAGSGDGLASIIDQVTISKGSNNVITEWSNAIEGAILYGTDITAAGISGTISADNIVFSASPFINIADGTSETYQLKIYLKTDLSSINEHDIFDFELDAVNVITDPSGSSFATGNVSSGAIPLEIVASKLQFQSITSTMYTHQNFSCSIAAVDINGNIDLDFNNQVTLTVNSGTGNLTSLSGLSKNAAAGIANWADLQYDTEESYRILAATSGLTNNSVTSQTLEAITPTSEIFDDFEDGDLNGWGNSMDWDNSNIEAINGSLSLKHNLDGTVGSSYIFHDLAALSLDEKSVVWRFKLKNGDWDPTTQNRFWFYLLANENDLLSASVDGYAVGVQMAAAGSEDFLSLWKITDGTIEQLLIESEFDWGASNTLGIEVVRTTSGNWMLSYDENANFDNLKLAGSAVNTDYQFTDYCGLVFRFEGATFRAGELWLDDLSISPDNISPSISSVITINSNTLKIQFSEQLNQSIAETINNYIVTNFEQPSNVTLNTDQTSIELSFASEFITNQNYKITVSNIEDISGNIMPDSTLEFVYVPFIVEQIFIPARDELLLDFSHPLEQSSAENLNNYMVDNSIGRPFAAELINDTLVRLQFADFTANTNYSVNVSDIKDKVGILINGTDIPFLYYPGNEFDVVINELMVDISPAPNVLPSAKYIELFNRSATAIDLSGWWFQVGNNSPRNFDNYILNPKEYLILCAAGTITDFISFGDALGVLSESQLISSGTAISLFNPEWKIIDYVNYSENWYAEDSKKNGGWSLERIDNDNFCGETNNWKASVDFKGGTPGKINSVYTPNTDESLPALLDLQVASSNKLILSFSKNLTDSTALNTANYSLNNGNNIIDFIQFSDTSRKTVIIKFMDHFYDRQPQEIQIINLNDFCGNVLKDTVANFNYYLIYPKAAYAESSNYLRIIFSEEVDILSAQEPGNYVISEGIGSPAFAFKHTEKRNEVFLEFPAAFSNAQYYKIAIKNVKDLNGNIMNSTELDFSFFNPSFNDLVINEILFNPKPGGVDFVEIYNKSNWPVDLSKLTIARRNDEGNLESFKVLAESNLFIEPGHFIAISSDTAITKSNYPAISYDTFIQIPVLPAYNADEGTVLLLYKDTIIDEFSYNDKMHFALITDAEGISLERIDPLKPTNDPDNWHSAAESYGFATPANKNSQFMQLSEGIDGELTIEPETFSPNNDGFEDVVFIRYKFNEPGYLANVSIYDGKGLLIKRLANNELLATEGEFSWDGLYQNNAKARIGIYVIYFEVFNLQGVVKKTKKTCVLAARLN